MKIGKIIRNWKVIILIVALFFSLIAISPNPFAKGVVVEGVSRNSTIAEQGLSSGEIIKEINGQEILTLEDYGDAISKIGNESEKQIIKTDKQEYIFLASSAPDITVSSVRSTHIKEGLDLAGGTRVLLKPVSDKEVTDTQINNLIDILRTRLDVYGLGDVSIRNAKDLSGNKYVLVEISGATKQEVKELIAQQGKFEAKVGNETVFVGEKEDIRYVCKNDGTCSGIRSCGESGNGQSCRFEFAITLSDEAAKKHAEATKDLSINFTGGERYLDKPLELYLDGQLVDSLLIGADLKGREVTDISISGPGFGVTREDAVDDALKNMNKLQTVLTVGSLPFDLEIVSLSEISPVLGSSFVKNVFLAAFLAILGVCLVIYIRYRQLKIVIPVIITMLSEIFIILGVAAFIKWRLDLVSIAGILASVGTGVDDQIVITDETLRGGAEVYNWKDKIKKAFFIILVAYLATVAAMAPLFWAGAGLIKGFALTTIIGVTIGVFITRPAFAAVVEGLIKE